VKMPKSLVPRPRIVPAPHQHAHRLGDRHTEEVQAP
jgi:hypothetical protein